MLHSKHIEREVNMEIYRKTVLELLTVLETMTIEELKNFEKQWEKELMKKGFSGKVQQFCRKITELVIEQRIDEKI